MSDDHDHDHDHDHEGEEGSPLGEVQLRVQALESLLVDKGLIDPAALDALIDTYENKVGPRNGARLVARAWVDPDFGRRPAAGLVQVRALSLARRLAAGGGGAGEDPDPGRGRPAAPARLRAVTRDRPAHMVAASNARTTESTSCSLYTPSGSSSGS
jgi:hypothetical protein